MRIDRTQQVVHERQVHHRGLVNDHEVHLQWSIFAPLKTAFARVEFEQAMNRHRLLAGALGHALGGASGRRRQNEAHFGAAQDRQQRGQQRRLPCSRSAGDHQNFFTHRLLDSAYLFLVQNHGRRREQLGADQIDRAARAAQGPTPRADDLLALHKRWSRQQVLECCRHPPLGLIKLRQINVRGAVTGFLKNQIPSRSKLPHRRFHGVLFDAQESRGIAF